MLIIPDEVKALFKRDDIFKNFHVHFPNGEYTDLNNDDVVTESVSFTESLCSQQAFRFGLTEASELKFTAVGIPNIRGVTIEAAIEINVEELGAAWISAHAPTGNEDFLDPQTCTYSGESYYRIPYGRFIVDTCPRNHESMWKREVTAYTERLDSDNLANPFQTNFLNTFFVETPTYKANLKPIVYSCLYKDNPDALLSMGYTSTLLSRSSYQLNVSKTLTLKTAGGTSKTITFESSYWESSVSRIGRDLEKCLIKVNWTNPYSTDTIGRAVEILTTYGIDAAQSGYSSLAEIASVGTQGISGSFSDLPITVVSGGVAYNAPNRTNIPTGIKLIYPYIEGESRLVLCAVTSTFIINETDSQTETIRYSAPRFELLTDSDVSELGTQAVSFNSTLQTDRKYDDGTVYKSYSFANAFSISGLVAGFLELQCRFGSPARTGGMEITGLDNTNPISIIPSEYSSLWYDETVISPIGYVEVEFKDESGSEQDITVQIGTGSSVYDLRDNEVIANIVFSISQAEAESGVTIESKIIEFLNSVFTPNIPDLTFVPIELEKKGLPYLEAGDAIEIETEDGQIVPSFILRQTITGIQYLSADVESSNGEAMEMIET